MAKVTINERSWAIDLISEINKYLQNKQIIIRHAGGENTLKNSTRSLFPDLLLFGETNSDILQGWELKMPDTSINDIEFINNAKKKAQLLKLDSFLLWNVNSAVLYKNDGVSYNIFKTWLPLVEINTREDVSNNPNMWKSLMEQILLDLNDFFVSGNLSNKKLIDNLSIDGFINVILENTDQTALNIKNAATKDRILSAEIQSWWLTSKNEYNDSGNIHQILARLVLTDWLIKFVFANIIKINFNAAKAIESVNFDSSVDSTIALFETISNTCDFWNIFTQQLCQHELSNQGWDQLVQINLFLKEINIQSIDVRLLHTLLQNSIFIARRKVAGQYCTPQKLAELLVKVTIVDATQNILDPCCGTGTIINEAYKLKESHGISSHEITQKIWASDKFSYPLQLAMLSLTSPSNYGQIINIFRADVINLEVGKLIDFINPNNGEVISKKLPPQKYIVSNLPFVQQENLDELNPNIAAINDWIILETKTTNTIDGRSDLFAYIPFYLYRLLEKEGKIGIIISNAWLGTDYGKSFIKLLQSFFIIETIIVSGKGKWFDNANVVTAIVVLKKKNGAEIGESKFCILQQTIEKIEDIDSISNSILLGNSNTNILISKYTDAQICRLENMAIPWSAYFADLSWLIDIQDTLIPVKDIFHIARGERRGWNEMFYPEANHGIENIYLQPVLKNLKGCKGLIAKPNKIAFCCGLEETELIRLNHNGALNWIRKFQNQTNTTGIPLTESLIRPNHHWYEMKTDTIADFAANINYGESLYIAKLATRSFVDQRIIPLLLREEFSNEDPFFLLALLNSTISMFYIEALGFGRGLGALDLNSKKFANGFKLLNPNRINAQAKNRISMAFKPLLNRDRFNLEKELIAKDRIEFEKVLYGEYGLGRYYPLVEKALKNLFRIRMAVND